MKIAAQILAGIYLGVVLATWPVVVIAFRLCLCDTWCAAQQRAWARFNEMRREPHTL